MNSVSKSSWLINERQIATRITLIFLLLSSCWVLITLALQPMSMTEPAIYIQFDLLKDGGYILVATVLLYWLIRRNLVAFRQSEKALRQSEERYRTLMENLPIGVYRTTPGPAGQFLMINRAGLHIFGYASEEALRASPVSDVYVDPVERARFSERLLAQGHATGVQLQLKRQDGTPIWASVTATVVYDEQGRAAYFDCTLEDITARKQVEEALLETSQMLSAIFESAPLAIMALDLEGRVQLWNPAAERIFGWKEAEALGQKNPIVPPDQREAYLDHYTRTLQGEDLGVSEVRRQRKDGTFVDISRTAATLYDAYGQPKGVVAVIADITDRKQSEAVLAREREMLHALMDNIPDTIYFKDTASRFTLINRAQVQVLGVGDPSHAIGRTDADFFLAEVARGAFEEEQAIVATGQPLIDREQYNPTRDGRPRWFSDTKTPIRDKDGQVIGLVGVSRDITARKQIEEKLRVSEAELRALFNAMPDVIMVLDRQGRYLQIAPTNPALLYRPSTELLGKTLHEVFAVEQADLFLEAVRRAADTRQTVNLEYSLTIDNREIWFAATFSPLLEDSVLLVARDVTDRRLAETALRESEQRYHNLFEAERRQLRLARTLQAVGGLLTTETSLDEVFNYLFDLLAHVVNYDSVSIQMIENDYTYLAAGRGFANEEQMRKILEAVSRPTLEERWGQRHQRLLVIPDTQTDSRWIPAAGSEFIRSWIGAALRVKGRLLGILNVDSKTVNAFDESVGETVAAFANQAAIAIENAQLHEAVRRHADELEQRVIERTAELERERQRIQAILDAAGEGIVFTDSEGIIEYVNPALEKLTGYAASEVCGQNLRLWRSSGGARAIIDDAWRVIRRGELWAGEMVNRRKDGALYEVAITIAPLTGAAGDLIGQVGILHDITHQKEVERLKDQFVTNVSHELRTPLANVKLYLNLLERGRPEKRGEYMLTLHREAARLTNLIEDMLDISRLDLGATPIQSLPTDLNPLIEQLIIDRSALAGDRSLSIERQLDPDLPPVLADPPPLTQVMSNLMTNAINYTPPGGVITISTAVRERQQRRWITFSVRDTGPGIAPQDLPHLFERFYRGEVGRKSGAPGTGLGLAICQEIMTRMDGQITVESRPATEGSGATFTVWLRPVDEELP